MQITAQVTTGGASHVARVATNSVEKTVSIPAREGSSGSSLNGGELLFLALATCYGNDIFREAIPRGIHVDRVEVVVAGEFGEVGEPARTITYRVRVAAHAAEAEIVALILHTDTMAEIQNTIRQGMPIVLESYEAISIRD